MTKKQHIILAIAFISMLAACMNEGSEGEPKGRESSKAAAELYRQNCRLCHGAEGDKMLGGASDLSISSLDQESRIAIISNGRGTMASFSDKLSAAEIETIASYLESLIAN